MILSSQVGFLGLFNLLYCLLSWGIKMADYATLHHFAGVFGPSFITKPLQIPMSMLKPEETRWQDGDITMWRKMQAFNVVLFTDFNTLPYAATCSFPCCWILQLTEWSDVSLSQTPVLKTSMINSKTESSEEHGPVNSYDICFRKPCLSYHCSALCWQMKTFPFDSFIWPL